MKAQAITIFTILMSGVFAMVLDLSSCAPASAQDRGARFTFAPNVYKVEGPRYPRAAQMAYPAQPAHTVTHGSVPQSANFLGLDKNFVSKPSPPPQATVAARPIMTSVTPAILPKSSVQATPYRSSFGKPETANAQKLPAAQPAASAQAAKLPAQSQSPAPAVARSTSAKRVAKSPSRSSKSVNARIATAKKPVGQKATPAIASYGNTKHYQAGSFGAGTHRTSASVEGKVLPRNQ